MQIVFISHTGVQRYIAVHQREREGERIHTHTLAKLTIDPNLVESQQRIIPAVLHAWRMQRRWCPWRETSDAPVARPAQAGNHQSNSPPQSQHWLAKR